MAIIVLGIAGLALMAAFSTTISGSAQHRSLAANDLVLRAAAESAFSLIEQQTSPAYSTCPSGYSDLISQYNAAAATQGEPNFGAPSQTTAQPGQVWYTAQISNVQYWDSTNGAWTTTTPTDCTASIPQLITMKVTNGVNGTTESTSFTVNDLNATVGTVTAVSVVSISPREIPVGDSQLVTITGSGFTSTSSVSTSNPNIQVSSIVPGTATSTSIQVTIGVPPTVATGSYDVTVTTGAVSGTGTGMLTVTPNATVASIQPQYLAQNANGGTYTLYGTGFETGMTVSIPYTSTGLASGVTLSNLNVTSSTTATFTLAASGVAATPLGSDPINVDLSSTVQYTSAPVLQVISPPSISSVVTASTLSYPCDPTFGGTADCIIYGTGFESGETVKILTNAGTVIGTVNTTSPTPSPTDPTQSQTITFNVSGSTAAATQGLSATVEVLNPDGSSVQYVNGFKNG